MEEEETINPIYMARVEQARTEIESYIENVGECFYANLSRRFPEYQCILTEVLLTSDRINYNDNDPAPSRVRLETQEFRKERQKSIELGFNNQPREKFDAMLETRKTKSHATRHGKQLAEMMA